MSTFTHINCQGEANMVDVSGKQESVREARAEAFSDNVTRNAEYDYFWTTP